MTWTNSLSPGSLGGAKTREPWPANGSGQAGRVEIMDRPKRDYDEDYAVPWKVNRCPRCQSTDVVVTQTRRNRPARGFTTRQVKCQDCDLVYRAQESATSGD